MARKCKKKQSLSQILMELIIAVVFIAVGYYSYDKIYEDYQNTATQIV